MNGWLGVGFEISIFIHNSHLFILSILAKDVKENRCVIKDENYQAISKIQQWTNSG